jgi:hypothetical protein
LKIIDLRKIEICSLNLFLNFFKTFIISLLSNTFSELSKTNNDSSKYVVVIELVSNIIILSIYNNISFIYDFELNHKTNDGYSENIKDVISEDYVFVALIFYMFVIINGLCDLPNDKTTTNMVLIFENEDGYIKSSSNSFCVCYLLNLIISIPIYFINRVDNPLLLFLLKF